MNTDLIALQPLTLLDDDVIRFKTNSLYKKLESIALTWNSTSTIRTRILTAVK